MHQFGSILVRFGLVQQFGSVQQFFSIPTYITAGHGFIETTSINSHYDHNYSKAKKKKKKSDLVIVIPFFSSCCPMVWSAAMKEYYERGSDFNPNCKKMPSVYKKNVSFLNTCGQ
jgi:hypothetical protein